MDTAFAMSRGPAVTIAFFGNPTSANLVVSAAVLPPSIATFATLSRRASSHDAIQPTPSLSGRVSTHST